MEGTADKAKEQVLEEFKRSKLRLLGITETKKKGKGSILTEMGHILIYGGKEKTEKAGAGVEIIIHKDFVPILVDGSSYRKD